MLGLMKKQNSVEHHQDVALEVLDILENSSFQFLLENQTYNIGILNLYYMLIGVYNSAVHHQDVALEVPGGDLVNSVILYQLNSVFLQKLGIKHIYNAKFNRFFTILVCFMGMSRVQAVKYRLFLTNTCSSLSYEQVLCKDFIQIG